jgi:hypothetical protein
MNKITFRGPHHQSPENIAYSFTYEPYVSIKKDGVFHSLKIFEKKNNFHIIPHDWIKI